MSGATLKTTKSGIVYSDRGDGPAVVLLHGWCLSRRMWMYQEEALLADHRVLCPDMPGFGESAGLAGPYTIERYGAELTQFLDDAGVPEATVVGFALGAAIAMSAVADHGARPSGVVLIGVPSAATAPYARMPKAMRRDWPDFARRSALAICRQPQSDATMSWLGNLFGATPLPVAIETVALLGLFEPLPLAPRIGVPALLVHGADDDVSPIAVPEACAQQIAGARLEIVPESGHFVVLDQKERLSDLIRADLAARLGGH